jgi:hypothetical protein
VPLLSVALNICPVILPIAILFVLLCAWYTYL